MTDAHIGVNFQGLDSAAYQNVNGIAPHPPNYIEDSFRIFAERGIKCIRVLFYWESFERQNDFFFRDINNIATLADKYGLNCIYDNHQWECSSWMGWGIGMPNSILSSQYGKRTGQKPDDNEICDFWNKWWNRKLKTSEGEDAWTAQVRFLNSVINQVRARRSTLGFEILNEPELYNIGHYRKIGIYHEYMVKELRKVTDKPLFFCAAQSHGLINTAFLQGFTFPITRSNVVYDAHVYPPTCSNLIWFKLNALAIGNIPLYIGEFNSGYTNSTTLSKTQLDGYIQLLKKFDVYGWGLWQWSYVTDSNIPAFNLTEIKDDTIKPNDNFNYLSKLIQKYYQ